MLTNVTRASEEARSYEGGSVTVGCVTEIRAGVPEDVMAIADINVRSWQVSFRGYFPNEFLDSLNSRDREPFVLDVLTSGPPHHLAVAVEEDQVIGFVMLGPPLDADVDAASTLELYSLYIEPERIRTGLGRLLMGEALRYLREGPWTSGVLWAPSAVERTCRFYEAAGWYVDGEKTEEIPAGNPVDHVRYRIDLE